MDLGIPVTLVVKAPNQKINDQTIECGLGWTIKKLKEHIANVYPSKPVSSRHEHFRRFIIWWISINLMFVWVVDYMTCIRVNPRGEDGPVGGVSLTRPWTVYIIL